MRKCQRTMGPFSQPSPKKKDKQILKSCTGSIVTVYHARRIGRCTVK